MGHRVRDHTVDLCVARELTDPVDRPKFLRTHLAGRRADRHIRGSVGVETAECRGQHARRETRLTHREQNHRDLRVRLGQRQNPRCIGRFLRRGDDLVTVRRDLSHALQHMIETRGRTAVVVI